MTKTKAQNSGQIWVKLGVGVNDTFWGSIFKNKGNFSLWCQSIFLDIIQRNFSILSIFDGLPGKKLEPVNFIKSANSSKIGRVQCFARQTVKNQLWSFWYTSNVEHFWSQILSLWYLEFNDSDRLEGRQPASCLVRCGTVSCRFGPFWSKKLENERQNKRYRSCS